VDKDRSYRTLARDIDELVRMDLIAFDKQANGWRAKKEIILAFLPVRASAAD